MERLRVSSKDILAVTRPGCADAVNKLHLDLFFSCLSFKCEHITQSKYMNSARAVCFHGERDIFEARMLHLFCWTLCELTVS